MMDTRETTRLFKDEQGDYSWVYRLDMYKNYSILKMILKAMGICLAVVFGIIIAILLPDIGRYDPKLTFGVPLLVFAITILITIGCYYLVALIYGGYYVAIYKMNEKRIAQYQPSDQAQKNRAIGLFTAMAGIATGSAGTMAAGFILHGRTIVETNFDSIKSLTFVPSLGEIRVHSFLSWYTVYVSQEDYEFVKEYMRSRSTRARIKEK